MNNLKMNPHKKLELHYGETLEMALLRMKVDLKLK